MRRLRIVQVVPEFVIGGAERMAVELAVALRSGGHDVTVVSLFGPRETDLERMLAEVPVPIMYLDKRLGWDLRMYPRLRDAVRRLDPDIVHTHQTVLRYALPSFVTSRRCRMVHTVHSLAEHEVDRFGRVLQHVLFRGPVTPVAICAAVAESVARQYRIPPPCIIYNGVNVAMFRDQGARRQEWRRRNDVPADAIVFAAIGRLVPAKNFDDAIDAFAVACRDAPGALLLIAGDGPLRAAIESRARSCGLGRRVRLLGLRDDIPQLLGAADVVVASSKFEGHPVSLLEAMSAGKPIVAYAVGGVPEVVSDGTTGVLVPGGDQSALASAMTRLLDAGERARMGQSAARRADREFGVSTMADAYESLYFRLVARTAAERSPSRAA